MIYDVRGVEDHRDGTNRKGQDMPSRTHDRVVLILGSAPDAVACRDWPRSRLPCIVAINNAWRVRDDWDYLVVPDDFPADRLPPDQGAGQSLIRSTDYVPVNNRFGGIFYAGGTMAFTAGYWALGALRPTVLAFLGCDMVYANTGRTHFYGKGRPDPMRPDPSLRSLEAKSARLMLHARALGCSCVRLSRGESRLVFPSARIEDLGDMAGPGAAMAAPLFDEARAREDRLGYRVPSGRYWDSADSYDIDEIDALDRLWLEAAGFGAQTDVAGACAAAGGLRSTSGRGHDRTG